MDKTYTLTFKLPNHAVDWRIQQNLQKIDEDWCVIYWECEIDITKKTLLEIENSKQFLINYLAEMGISSGYSWIIEHSTNIRELLDSGDV